MTLVRSFQSGCKLCRLTHNENTGQTARLCTLIVYRSRFATSRSTGLDLSPAFRGQVLCTNSFMEVIDLLINEDARVGRENQTAKLL